MKTTIILLFLAIPAFSGNLNQTIKILCQAESSGREVVTGDEGRAKGILQMHKIMVRQANEVLGKKYFTYADRSNRTKSVSMCVIILRDQIKKYKRKHGREPSFWTLATFWNTGHINGKLTKRYRNRILAAIKELK